MILTVFAQVSNSASPFNLFTAMKKTLLTFYSTLCILNATLAQTDSLRYTQESGTLKEQRFIDRYDYVFMTKEPTKWMLKVGVTRINGNDWNDVGGTGVLGVEYKVAPAFSVGFNGTLESDIRFNSTRWGGEAFGRWYYQMNRRIREGRAANNFSGNYFGLGFAQFYGYNGFLLMPKNPFYSIDLKNVSLSWGLQRRFFEHGWADFRLSLGYNDYKYQIGGVDNSQRKTVSLSTSWQVGLAFGDLRTSKAKVPACDVFRCMETQRSWLKIRMPFAGIGLDYQQVGLGAAFEHRLGTSAFSINVEESLFLRGSNQYPEVKNGQFNYINKFWAMWQIWSNAELRYYFLKKRQIALGKSAANLSGVYAGLHQGVGFGQLPPLLNNGEVVRNNYELNYWTAPLVGIQQRLFKNGFIDVKIGIPIGPLSPKQVGNRVGSNVTDFKIGFAF
jgi:hypothetical protein